MILDIAIIALGVLVFVVPELVPKLVSALRRARRPPAAEERHLLDGERQRLVRERRRLAAERAEHTGARGAGCPWCGFPIPPPR